MKDNRILPEGSLPLAERIAIAKALGAGDDLAEDAGATAVGDDPDYVTGGGDSLIYRVPLADLPPGASRPPCRRRSTTRPSPPFYLQDRFCTSGSADTKRLYFLAGKLTSPARRRRTGSCGW